MEKLTYKVKTDVDTGEEEITVFRQNLWMIAEIYSNFHVRQLTGNSIEDEIQFWLDNNGYQDKEFEIGVL